MKGKLNLSKIMLTVSSIKFLHILSLKLDLSDEIVTVIDNKFSFKFNMNFILVDFILIHGININFIVGQDV